MENCHIVIGNLGADPELINLKGGAVKATFTVATSETWKDKQTGERSESVEWHNVEVWGKTAEACAKHLSQGRLVYVKGPHRSVHYETDGVHGTHHYIKADRVKFLGGKKK